MLWPAQFRVMRLSLGQFCLEVWSFHIPRKSKTQHDCWRRPRLLRLAMQKTTGLSNELRYSRKIQSAIIPPSTGMEAPVMYDAFADATKAIT